MKEHETPSILKIKNAVAAHFNIEALDMDVRDSSKTCAQARMIAVFLASKADHSNKDIAAGFNYKNAGHVSTILNRAQIRYTRATDDFYSDSNKIAKSLKLSMV